MKTRIAFLILIAAAVVANTGCRPQATTSAQGSPSEDPKSIQGIGYVEPASEIRRLMFNGDGVISHCGKEVGDLVKKEEVLMSLQSEEQQAEVLLAEKQLRMAEAEREKVFSGVNKFQITAAETKLAMLREQSNFATREFGRIHILYLKKATTVSDNDRADSEKAQKEAAMQNGEADMMYLKNFVTDEDRRVAEAKVEVAAAQLAVAKQKLENTILRAPCDGTVLELIKREGDGVHSTDPEPAVIFGDISRLRVKAEIDERYVRLLKIGQKAEVFGRGLGEQKFAGKVTGIKKLMGKKTVFSHASTERKDLEVLQVILEMDERFFAPVGLEADVKIELQAGL